MRFGDHTRFTFMTALLGATLALTACPGAPVGDGDGDGDTTVGDGDGDTVGDGDGDTTGDGDGDTTGDGDGDGDTTGDGDGDTETLDLDASSVSADPLNGLVANGADVSTVTVSLVDVEGVPLAGRTIFFMVEPAAGALVSSEVADTDAMGMATVNLTATVNGSYTVTAGTASVADGSALTVGTVTVDFDTCQTDEQFFKDAMEGPVFSRCIGCHNAWGRAPEFGAMQLKLPDEPGAAADNLTTLGYLTFDMQSDDGTETLPYLIAKPTAAISHGGGLVLPEGDPAIDALYALVERLEDDTQCVATPNVDFIASVNEMSPSETLRKAVPAITGRYALPDELAAFSGDEADLAAALDALMEEGAFSERVLEMFNDFLLTDEGLAGTRSLNQLPNALYPRRFWFRPCDEGFNPNQCCAAGECCKDDPAMDDAWCAEAGDNRWDNEAVAREPLELIKYVIDNDLPMTEVLTADYTLVNPYSAQVYGVSPAFDGDPSNDRNEYVTVNLTPSGGNSLSSAIPHAGVLSTPRYLRRYPTTQTNVNRHRARMVYEQFLDIDIMTFLNLVIDQEEDLGDNPFVDARTCSACHAALDPMAGTFKNYRNNSRYNVQPWWDQNPNSAGIIMRAPGYKQAEMPAGRDTSSLSWLSGNLAEERRFAQAMTKLAFELVTGLEPVKIPTETSDPNYAAHLLAYQRQVEDLSALTDAFIASGYNFKSLVKAVVMTPWFRAESIIGDIGDLERAALDVAQLGSARTVTPEQLDRKLIAITGYPYHNASNVNSANNLLNVNRFRLLAGGHDSDVIVKRFRDPFPIQSAVMATETVRRTSGSLSAKDLISGSIAWVFPNFPRAPADVRRTSGDTSFSVLMRA